MKDVCSQKKIVLFGAGGHAKVIIEAAMKASKSIASLLDSNPAKQNNTLMGFEIELYQSSIDLVNLEFVVSIGDDNVRKQWYKKLSKCTSAGIIIHPSAVITDFCHIGAGTVILGNANINPNTVIGENVIINTAAIIEHDCCVRDHSHIAPGATLCGGVFVGDCTLIGANATILPGRKIGNNVIVGAGAVVTEDIPDNVIVAGNPAKILKSNS